MANEVSLKIKIGDDGTLKVVAKEAKKATKATDELGASTDRVTKSRNKYHKAEKGVGQAGLSSAKSFSKMNQTIGSGSSGLVGAYAVLAANIFALTAAFGALQRAAQIQQLEDGLLALGTASGIAMQNLSRGLQEATGHALSLGDAMRATALAASAGFDSSSIERLGDVARKASIALGRDTADSLNRLTKGAIKLEPELLDELGIMVRLDEATEKYARALGKNANELTTFQKRQAFMNAVLEEGEEKFAAMGDVDTNPFDKLSATFQDLTKTLINILNVAILPVVNFFASSQAALFGAMVMFGRTIATAMIPALGNLGTKYAEVARASAAASLEQLKSLKNIEGGGANLKKLAQAYDPAIDGQDGLNKMMATARRSLASNEAGLNRLGDELGKTSEKYKEKNLKVKASEKALATLTQFQKDFNNTTTEDAKATAVASAAQGNYSQALGELGVAKKKMTEDSKKATATATRFGKVSGFVSLQAAKAAINVKVLGIAFLNMIPMIGQIIALFGVVISVISSLIEKFKDPATKEYEDVLEGVRERVDELTNSLKEVAKAQQGQKNTLDGIGGLYTALSNTLGTFASDVEKLNTLGQSGAKNFFGLTNKRAGAYKDILVALRTEQPQFTQALVKSAKAAGANAWQIEQLTNNQGELRLITDELAGTILTKTLPALQKFPDAVKNITETVKENSAAISDFINKEQVKTSVDEILAAFRDIEKGFADLEEMTRKESKDFFKAFKEEAQSDLKSIINFDDIVARNTTTVFNPFGSGEIVDYKAINKELKAALVAEEEILRKRQKQERLNKLKLSTSKAEISFLKTRALVEGTAVKILEEQEKIRKINVTTLQQQLSDTQRLIKAGTDLTDNKEKEKNLKRQIELLGKQELTNEEKIVAKMQEKVRIIEDQQKAERALIDFQQKNIDLANRGAEAQEEIALNAIRAANSADPRNRGNAQVSAAQKYAAIYQETDEEGLTIAARRIKATEDEFKLKRALIELEYGVIEARMKALRAEVVENAKKRGEDPVAAAADVDTVISGLSTQKAAAITVLNLEEQAALGRIEAARIQALAAVKEQFRTGGVTDSGVGSSNEALDVLNKATPGQSTTGGDPNTTTGGNADEPTTLDRIAKTKQVFEELQQMAGNLGPGGELISNITAGATSIADAWSVAGSSIKGSIDTLDEGAAVATAASQTFQAIGGIMQAASQAKVAGIDREIAAEKKRDGKSKESLEKIKALEKKKEAIQKKNFEMQKKIQMASIIADTAAAIMKNMGQFGAFGLPLVPMIAAMGAAQLAVVASQSFQGSSGGISSGASTPSSISLGKRRNTVDVAKSQSAGGELSYMRGARGSGGPENFRPAFYGKKMRATGGYVVGEQGPELFMPDRPGTIVPADDTATMAGGSNVTFTINAIDATGVEEVLEGQQGNIIGMLRQAANSYGQEFFEDVDETTYTSPTARRA